MSTTITLIYTVTGAEIWTFKGDGPIIQGILVATIYSLTKLGTAVWYQISRTDDPLSPFPINSLRYVNEIAEDWRKIDEPVTENLLNTKYSQKESDDYTIFYTVPFVTALGERLYSSTAYTDQKAISEFAQGVLTIAKEYNIPGEEMLPFPMLHDDEWYGIQGVKPRIPTNFWY